MTCACGCAMCCKPLPHGTMVINIPARRPEDIAEQVRRWMEWRDNRSVKSITYI